MFQMFGFGGVKCPRCEHKNDDDSGDCAQCGLTLGASRNEALLRDNRWAPGAGELAVFFGVRQLAGVFSKTLTVPSGARAFILQDEAATEVASGEYQIDRFLDGLRDLLRERRADILVTGTAALPLEFAFDDLQCAEQLPIAARFALAVRIEQPCAFARHFMRSPGAVNAVQLHELLAPSVREMAAQFIAARSLRDLAANADLRAQLDERLQSGLQVRLSQYGLGVSALRTLALRHDKLDAHQQRVATLSLVLEQGQAQLEHAKRIDQLYSEEEWQRIHRESQESRLRHRRAELRQDETIERADLSLRNAERAQAIRVREIELYARIVEAKNRKQALERGAEQTLVELDHELAKNGAAREDDSVAWAHLRQLAAIKMRTELEIAQQDALEAGQLARQRFAQQLLQQQIAYKISQALGIEDEARKRAELARQDDNAQALARRERELEDEQHQARRQAVTLVNAAHRREAERLEEWQDQLALGRQRELLRVESLQAEEIDQKLLALRRGCAQAESLAQHEKLLRTIDADGLHARAAQQLELEAQERRQALEREGREALWQQELKRLELAREQAFAQLGQQAEMARIEVTRVEAIGAMSDSAKLALAPAPNAGVLADWMKTGLHAAMSAQQLTALSAVVAAGKGVTPAEAQQAAQEQVRQERLARAAEIDKDRGHQIELLALQNAVNQAALAAQSELGVGVVQGQSRVAAPARRCANGHAAAPHDRFCAQCGAALPT
jgi:hypothetical protein